MAAAVALPGGLAGHPERGGDLRPGCPGGGQQVDLGVDRGLDLMLAGGRSGQPGQPGGLTADGGGRGRQGRPWRAASRTRERERLPCPQNAGRV